MKDLRRVIIKGALAAALQGTKFACLKLMKSLALILSLSVFISACGPQSDCGGSGFDQSVLGAGNGYVPDTGEGCGSSGGQQKRETCDALNHPELCVDQ